MPIATSTVKLWKNIVLSPDKNYVIEDLTSYLGTADTTISNFQFVELKKTMTIKIVLAQYNLQFDSTYNFNYCHISRSQGSSFSANDGAYYFVKAMRWKSTEAVELDLEMDVLNTFEWDDSYSVTDKTMVKREHKNRFSQTNTFHYQSDDILIDANSTKAILITNPLIQEGGVDSITNFEVQGGTTAVFTPSSIPVVNLNTEYYFTETGSSPGSAAMETSGNKIIFRRYNQYNQLLQETKVAKIDYTSTHLRVYYQRGGLMPIIIASVEWADYPLTEPGSLAALEGRYTFELEDTPTFTNQAVFFSGLAGTVVSSETVTAIAGTFPYLNPTAVRVTFTNTGSATKVKVKFDYTIKNYIAEVDLKSEGINPPLYKKSESNIEEPSGVSWSLLYKNSGTPNESPVDCYLYPSENLTVTVPSTANTLTKDNVPSSHYAVIFQSYNGTLTYTFQDDQNRDRSITPQYSESMGDVGIGVIAFKATSTGVEVWGGSANYSPYVGDWWGSWTKIASNASSVAVSGSLSSLKYYPTASLPSVYWISQHYNEPIYATGTISMSALISATLQNKDSIDRTDEKNIKLITLPYAPTPVVIDHSTSEITIGGEWYFNLNDGTLKLNDLNSKFKNRLDTKQPHLMHPLVYKKTGTWDGTANRFLSDPKNLHSDYYYQKFVYDSFSKIFKLETLDWQASAFSTDLDKFTFDFVTSRNIVSKFLFMFPQYTTGSKGTEDYDNILPVARNNEEVLFNSQYLNYLRTGYNYDLKTKERNEVAGGVGIGLSAAALAASAALAFIPGIGPALSAAGVMGVIGSGIGLVNSAVNYAKTTAQAEENIQRKLQESQNQAVSVLNADDFDLLEAYSNNVAKMCTYEVSSAMKSALNDMFHYAGYVVNEQYKPQIDTRYWFNFLQAELVIDTWDNVAVDIQEQLKQKFNEGVTFFHCHTINSVKTWDIAQEKENLEKWIVLANGGAQ